MWEWWEKDTSTKSKGRRKVNKTKLKLKWGTSEYSSSYYINYILYPPLSCLKKNCIFEINIKLSRCSTKTQAWVMYLPCNIYHQSELGKSHPFSHKQLPKTSARSALFPNFSYIYTPTVSSWQVIYEGNCLPLKKSCCQSCSVPHGNNSKELSWKSSYTQNSYHNRHFYSTPIAVFLHYFCPTAELSTKDKFSFF